ncbi:MAG TPA: carbon-nitrogen hydrolase family protein [Atribacteraceae bacterium]|nr:carbon-nitrogen hydrolase family protein [Atribacteraceae bacterium]
MEPPKLLRIGIIQVLTGVDKADNLRRTDQLARAAAGEGAELIVLPEMFACPYEPAAFSKNAEAFPDGECYRFLAELARNTGAWIVGGSLPEREGNRIYNSSFIYDTAGKLQGVHRKIHLFDVNFHSLSFRESTVIQPGNTPTLINTPWGRLGVLICYDLRFPELSRWYALRGAGMIAVPAAFNRVTGSQHWNILFRTRAVDNQVFIFGASPATNPGNSYQAYGHSLVVDPMGRVLGELGKQEGYLVQEIDLDELTRTRNSLPLLRHRRPDLYALKPEMENYTPWP